MCPPRGHLPGKLKNTDPRTVALATTSLAVGECHSPGPYVRVGGCAVPSDSVRRQSGARLGRA